MSNFFAYPGFLGTEAPLISDLTLILMLLTAALFTLGWRLAVHQRYAAHRWVQTCTVFLNTIVVLIVMVSSFVIFILLDSRQTGEGHTDHDPACARWAG
jgi:hypothetical protein